MTTTNTTAKYAGLARNGFTGTQEDRELSFYQANGATSNSLSDAENQFLIVKGFTTGTVNDKWTAYLVSLGYTGSKDDMINRWWGNFPGSTVNMNFTLGTLDSRITFTRSTTATYYNSAGVLTTAAINAPRFDYNPATLASVGLLIEEQRANLAVRSDDFANASWTKTRSSITSNAIVAPDGTTTADKLVEDTTATSTHLVGQSVVLAINQTYTLSVFAKAGERGRIVLQTGSVANWVTEVQVGFDLTTGTVFNTGLGTSAGTITPVGNGWYRCSIVATMKATGTSGSLNIILCPNGTATFSYTGDGISGAYIWGAQVEAGAFITSYIPTVASQVTRTADVAVMNGTNFSSWYNASQGTFAAIYEASPNAYTSYLVASNGTTAQNSCHFDNDSGNMRVVYYSGSSAVATLSLGAIGTVGAVNKVASAYLLNSFAASRNGGTVVTDSAGAVPVSVTQLNIGADPSGAATNVMNTHIRQITYYPRRLSNAELQGITS